MIGRELQRCHRVVARAIHSDIREAGEAALRMEQFSDMLLVGLAGLLRRPLFAASSEERADMNVGALLAR